jgi:hypothetical protein
MMSAEPPLGMALAGGTGRTGRNGRMTSVIFLSLPRPRRGGPVDVYAAALRLVV